LSLLKQYLPLNHWVQHSFESPYPK